MQRKVLATKEKLLANWSAKSLEGARRRLLPLGKVLLYQG